MATKTIATAVAHPARVHGYRLAGKDRFACHLAVAPLTAPPARGGTFRPIDKMIITLRSVATPRRVVGVGLGANLADGRGVGLSVDLLRLCGSDRLRHRRQPAPAADGRDERGLPDNGPVLRAAGAGVLLAVGPGRPASSGCAGVRAQGIRAAARERNSERTA